MHAMSRPAAVAPIAPLGVHAHTATCALGHGLQPLRQALADNRSGLRPHDLADIALPCAVGPVAGLATLAWPADWACWDSRATRLAWWGLQADDFAADVARSVQRHGATRVGLVLGSSASTIASSEAAYRQLAPDGGFAPEQRLPHLHNPHAVTAFVQMALGLQGPAQTVSTACSSGAKAYGVAERWLRLGLVDAVVVAGVDALGGSLLHGFHALQLLSPLPCRPFAADRQGISIGEAAAFALLERSPAFAQLLGHGDSNDAHHMSSPHPQGLGAEQALDAALARAARHTTDIDLVHLHGTATPSNDAVEAALVARRYWPDVHACATKGLTGHTMGAAGALQASICLLALQHGLAPGSAPTLAADPALGHTFANQWQPAPVHRVLRTAASHSFGFGGNNCVLVFGC